VRALGMSLGTICRWSRPPPRWPKHYFRPALSGFRASVATVYSSMYVRRYEGIIDGVLSKVAELGSCALGVPVASSGRAPEVGFTPGDMSLASLPPSILWPNGPIHSPPPNLGGCLHRA